MGTPAVTLDFSKAMPIGGPPSPVAGPAAALQGAVSYGAQQNPDQYAKLLRFQKLTGVPPVLSNGNEQQVQQAADVNAIDYTQFAAANPRTTAWASNPDNAAVSGVSEIQRLGAIEQHAAVMRAYTPSVGEQISDKLSRFGSWMMGGTMSPDQVRQNFWENPVTRYPMDAASAGAGILGNVGSFLGWHGDGPTKQNLLQRIESSLDPATAGAYVDGQADTGTPLDAAAKFVGPGVAGGAVGMGVKAAGMAAGLSSTAATVLSGLGVGGMFTADQGGRTYTAVAGAGGSDYDARLKANRVAAINALPNALFGATDLPLLKDFPLLTSAGIGAATGASGQFAQNQVTGRPWSEGLLSATAQGAAMQGGLHIGMGALAGDAEVAQPTPAPAIPQEFAAEFKSSPFLSSLAGAVSATEGSQLRERAPDKFNEAMQGQFEGDASLRIPSDQFSAYFKGQGADPAEVAKTLGSTNYPEALLSGGDVEVPQTGFLAKLDPEYRKALLPDVVDPSTGLSARQYKDGRAELEQWATGGGIDKTAADMAAADAETAATPEYQQVKEQLRQRYVDAGETPEVAETLAGKDANAYSNLARNAGMKPDELLRLYNPKVVSGDAPVAPEAPAAPVRPVPNEESAAPIQFKAPDESSAKSVGGHDGKATTLLTPARELPAKYRLMEADALQPSHDAQTFAKNPAYPEGLQERAYDTSKEAQNRVIQQAQNYDPRYTVNTNPDAVNGPPVVTPDGTVLGGNSRAMSTQRLYAEDGSAYKEALKEQASAYGFTPEQVDGMKKPVLVRQVDAPATEDDARRLGSELNKSMTGAMGVSERAVSAGKNIKPETLRSVANMMQDDTTLREAMSKHGADIVKMLTQDGVITDRERPQFVDAETGGLSEEGKTFVERALLGSVIDDPRLMDAAPKSVKAKLERSLGSITSFASRADEWNILPAIRESVGDLGEIQRRGSTLDLHLGQTSMFGEERNPLVDAMTRALDGKPNDVRSAFADFAKDADENMPGQARMFGEAKAFDAFNHAFGSTLTEQEYHDGLRTAAGREPADAAGSADAGRDEGVPGSTAGDAAPGSQGSVAEGAGSSGPGEPLNQSSDDGTRGWFRVLPDGSYEIGKTKIGDLSTFVHEPAHAYLKILGDLAKRDDASEVLKGDYQKVLDYLGAKDGEPFTREQQETWARANEQYLREGKAPSASLKGAFQRFAIWLGTVYKHASDLGVELNDNIRGVFDRLYAAESGVEKADSEAGPKLFTSAEEAGWTDEEFKNYADAKGMGVEQAKSEILGKLNEAAVREKTQRWRAEEKNVRTAVTAQVDQSPEYTAIRSLRRGAMDDGTALTMDREGLVQQFGEDRVQQLQKQHPGLYRNEGGMEPETAAELLGFLSADHMMTTLEDTQRRGDVIDKGTRFYMAEKHGDIRYDGTLDDQARLALENDKKSDSLYRELSALKKQVAEMKSSTSGQKEAMRSIEVAPIASYREAAHQMIESKPVADLQASRYLDASRKYSREAFDALRKGDANAAAEAKHKELMNHFLFREATNAQEYVGRFESYAKRMQNKGVQGSIGKAGSDYLSQFNKLLFRYGIGKPPLEAPDRSLQEWASTLFVEGKEAAIDPSIYDESRVVNYRQASVAEVRNLHDALINIRHLAAQELSMEVNGRKVEFSAAMERMNAQARKSLTATPRPVFDENRTAGMKAGDLVNRGTALLKRTEFLMKQLDGGTSGPWHDNLWHLAADAQGKEDELQHEVTQKVGDALQNMPKEQRARLLDKVTIDGVTEPLTRRTMIAMAFNMGNEGNLERLEKTFIAHGWEPRAIEQIRGELTREEWKFVQDGWDSLKPLGQEQSALEKRLTGLPPVMVRPVPLHLELKDGSALDLDGGYYPVVMDPRYSQHGAQQDAGMTAQNLMESGYGRATTSRGNMKERTGYGGPLQLDYEQVLTQHTAKVVKDISHREFMLTANKLLMDPTLRQTMRETVGEANEKQMMPWLRTIINDSNGSSVQGLGDVSRAMSGLRTNVVKAALGFKFSTLLLQLTHASSVFLHTSPSSYAQAMIDFMAHPQEMTEQIKGLSPNEMASRGDNLDRDMRKVLRDGVGQKSVGDMWAKAGMWPVQMMDHVLSFPLWLSVYRDAMASHAETAESMRPEESEAKYQAMQKADGAVRMGLGSNAPKDLAPIMRNHDLTKLLTTMGGFHNLKYNQMADVASQFRNGGGFGKLTYGMIMAGLIPAVMGPLITGRGPKDGENVAGWAAKRALLFPAETMAILNIGVEALENHGDMRYSPIASMLERTAKDGAHAMSDSDSKDWTGMGLGALQTAMEGLGVSGTDQAFKVGRYARQAAQGKIENPNPWDAVAGGPPHR
jgi:hypothetical protein